MENQSFAQQYYDKFSKVYDIFSPKTYYHKARTRAIRSLALSPGQTVLNVPCGTGQNFGYLQQFLQHRGQIIGVDLSAGMLQKAQNKINKYNWDNISLIQEDVLQLDEAWLVSLTQDGKVVTIDAILCDLGLSGFPAWQQVINNLIAILKPGGTIVIMDWYMEKRSMRGAFIEWIGKGEVTRPIWQYLEPRVKNFKVDRSFNRGGVFVASGKK